jgi:hypothetical protein
MANEILISFPKKKRMKTFRRSGIHCKIVLQSFDLVLSFDFVLFSNLRPVLHDTALADLHWLHQVCSILNVMREEFSAWRNNNAVSDGKTIRLTWRWRKKTNARTNVNAKTS